MVLELIPNSKESKVTFFVTASETQRADEFNFFGGVRGK